jgi:hypothetical protein
VELQRVPKLTIALIVLGFVALVGYFFWWFQDHRLLSPWLLASFIVAFMYSGTQLIGSWILYIAAYRIDKSRL